MSLLDFLEGLFCNSCKQENDRLVAENDALYEDKTILTQNYQTLALEKLDLVMNCNKDKLLLHETIQGLETVIDQLEEAGEHSFQYPVVADYDETPYDVSNITEFRNIEFIRADAKYNLFTKQEWINMLDIVHPLVKEALTSWKRDISDCDNWSTVSAALVSIAFKKSGYNIQGAYAIAHTVNDEPSRHAYNVFVDNEYKVWVYEPQNNTIKGVIEDMTGIYKTGYVLFLS